MRPEERDPAYLWDMEFTHGLTVNEFLAAGRDREITRLAVERKMEILGEAARRVSLRFKEEQPGIPWRQIIGLRNIISHQYDKVNYGLIYRVAREQIPELIALLEPLIPPLPPLVE